jgi:branched-chain amino acid transport system permease protein
LSPLAGVWLYGETSQSPTDQLLLPFTDPIGFYNSHELLFAQIGISCLVAISIWITLYSGQLTLANVGFMAIGAYTTVILTTGGFNAELPTRLPVPVAIALGSLLAGLISFFVGLPVLRLRGVFLAIATIGFGEALRFGVILNLGITGRGQGLKNTLADPIGGVVPIWISLVIVTYIFWRMRGTKLGQAWAAIREDELAASSQGINVPLYKMLAFVLGAIVAGFAGGLESNINFFVDPTIYGVDRAVQVLTFAVVGGISNVVGPVIGAAFLTALPEVIRQARDYRDVVNGLILILVIIFRPQGLIARGGLSVIRPRWWPESWTLNRARAAEA